MNLAVIPARGGSKRIPRKNIKPFCGKPMIAHSILAALDSGLFDRIIVSTDDVEIAETALQWGAEVPFMRPASLSDDHTGTMEVMAHAVDWIHANDPAYDYTCCIYATAPFIRLQDLKMGHALVTDGQSQYAFSVTTFPSPIFRALKISDSDTIEMFWPEHRFTRSQDLPEAYHDVGQFYWGTTQAFRESLPLFSRHAKPVIIPRYLAQDIDTPEDWDQAEIMYQLIHQKNRP